MFLCMVLSLSLLAAILALALYRERRLRLAVQAMVLKLIDLRRNSNESIQDTAANQHDGNSDAHRL